MLHFASPYLLGILPLFAAVGLWALLSTRRRRTQATSSLLLWKQLMSDLGPTPKRRPVNFWSILLLLAGLLLGVAIAHPTWTSASQVTPPCTTIEWSVRSVDPAHPAARQAFLRLHPQQALNDAALTLRVNDRTLESFDVKSLTDGIVLPLPSNEADAPLTLSLSANQKTVALQTFAPPQLVAPIVPFSLLTLTEAGRLPESALTSLIPLLPGYRRNDLTTDHILLLLDDTTASLKNLPGGGSPLVIASSRISLPGLSLDRSSPTVSDSPPTFAVEDAELAKFLHPLALSTVHVRHFNPAIFDATWQPLLTIDGTPWVALRKRSVNVPALLWLASNLTTDTDWPNDPSFVIFFADLQRWWLAQTSALPTDAQATTPEATLWTPFPATSPLLLDGSSPASMASATSLVPINLTPLLISGAILLLLCVFVRRWSQVHKI